MPAQRIKDVPGCTIILTACLKKVQGVQFRLADHPFIVTYSLIQFGLDDAPGKHPVVNQKVVKNVGDLLTLGGCTLAPV